MKIKDLPAHTLDKVKHIVDLEIDATTKHRFRDVELPSPTGWHILVLQYVRPDRVGSIIMADKTRDEDKYQGRVGIVLDLGPDAYTDEDKFPTGAWCQPGDWIMWPAVEGAARRFAYGKDAVLALVNDDSVLAVGVDPLRAVASG